MSVAEEALSFETPEQLSEWLRTNHATERELWVRIFKKGSGRRTVSWEDCVVTAITWGWIDGQRRARDDVSFLQRLTPRRTRSTWSMRNRVHAELLIAEGLMQSAGLAQVEAARQDGRWDRAYAGSAEMVMPDDLLEALRRNPAAERVFDTLDRGELFAIYLRIRTAGCDETRERRIEDTVERLGSTRIPAPDAGTGDE